MSTVFAPSNTPAAAGPVPELQAAADRKPPQRVVLIVDDDPDFVDIQQAEFEALGFQVITAATAAQAEEILLDRQPDLAVVDLMMENSDAGFCLSHEMKSRYPEMPVIMVTSAGSITGVDLDSLCGEARSWIPADAILSKPVRFEQIERELARLLKRN